MANEELRQHIRATEAEVKGFLLSLDRFLSGNLRRMTANLRAGKTSGAEAAQVLGKLQTALKDAGLDAELAKLQDIYAEQLRYINRQFRKLDETKVLTDADRPTVETLVTFDVSKVSNKVAGYLGDVRSTMMKSIIAGKQVSFDDLHSVIGDRLVANLNTEINTNLQAFNRTVTVNKGQELGYDLFIYLGPDDAITRPFCEHVLEGTLGGLERDVPIYSVDEIQGMDNEQGLPVMTYGGGYNCRHQWRPISEDEARSRGWDG